MTLPFTATNHALHCEGVRIDSIQFTSLSPTENDSYTTVGYLENMSSSQELAFDRYTVKNGLAEALNWTILMAHPYANDASLLDIYWIDWDQLNDSGLENDSQMDALWMHAMAKITCTNPDTSFDRWESFDHFRQWNADFMVFGHPFKSFFPNMRMYKPPFYSKTTHQPPKNSEQPKHNSQDLTENHAKNLELAAVGLKGRKLVTMDTGFLGLATETALKGDVVVVLFGCNFPVILRPFGNLFKYIGECYVQGLMQGEAIIALEQGEYQPIDIALC